MILPGIGAVPARNQEPPQVRDVQASGQGSGTSFVPTMPTHVAGDMLLAFIGYAGSTNITAFPPSGWTAVPSTAVETSVGYRVCYKIAASGSETLTVNNNFDDDIVAVVYAIKEHSSAIVARSTAATRDDSTLTPSWGTEYYLWFAALVTSQSTYVPGSAPSGFSSPTSVYSDVGLGAKVTLSLATQALAAGSLNAGAFSGAGNSNDIVSTVAVRPR